ncbi:ROK family protein [Microbacterium sp. Clip185]|uniref:ROK family protein n=1 Tax=Microbacterium sp. Clip185 TaxID=3025663 RepID=UPI0023664B2E|nr:ROK family protein [Microbacterium sp. Clip185]WDG18859.1 ROK family protein [Microbacterium sp. Clip185]
MRVGLDVGGTKTDAVVVDARDRVLASVRLATLWGPVGVVETVADAVAALSSLPGIDAAQFTSVGIGMPGQVRRGSGRVTHALNLGVSDLDVAAAVAPRVGLPVHVENDVKAAALGAAALEQPGTSLAFLNLGTGVAAGIVLDGALWRGAGGSAGEVGHISIDPEGPLCRCGGRGCIEALAGGAAIADRWGRPAALPVRDVFDAADAGDALATAIRRDLARAVAAAVRILVLTADVERVVLGGGLTALADRMLPEVRAELERSVAASPFLRSLGLADRMRVLPTGSPAAAVGAAIVGGTAIEQEVSARG